MSVALGASYELRTSFSPLLRDDAKVEEAVLHYRDRFESHGWAEHEIYAGIGEAVARLAKAAFPSGTPELEDEVAKAVRVFKHAVQPQREGSGQGLIEIRVEPLVAVAARLNGENDVVGRAETSNLRAL